MKLRIIRIIKQRRNVFAALLVLIVILVLWTVYLWWRLFIAPPSREPDSPLSQNVQEEARATTTLARRPIDGIMVPEEEATSSLFAVMLDNFPEARPVAGLSQASLVWEAPVEGGMSRFLAVFPLTVSLARLGPVRSARPYYLDWAKELEALYLHVGGSNQSLKEVKSKKVFNLNEFYRGWYFWRDLSRTRPYNVYTSSELINRAWQEEGERKNFAPRELESWLFKDEAELKDRGEGENIVIGFGKVQVGWTYHREENFYERFEDGEKQKDESGLAITAKNVILQYTSIQVLDEVGRRQIKTVGSGKAVIFRDGKQIVGTWQKRSLISRIRFFGPDTKEIEFNPGTTWVEVVAEGININF